MRIISKFQDYYDGAAGYGIDKSLVYVRKTEDLGILRDVMPRFNRSAEFALSYRNYYSPKHKKWYSLIQRCIVFCGVLHFIYQLEYGSEQPYNYYKATRIGTFASKKEAFEFLDVVLGVERYPSILRTPTDSWDDIEKSIEKVDWMELHQQYHCPIFAMRSPNWSEINQDKTCSKSDLILIGNPCLKDQDFYKFVDPYSAFQEISMFLGGALSTSGNEMVQLTDKDIHSKHGYDKWSFRRMPQKKT